VISVVNDWLWNYVLIAVLLTMGVFFTVSTRAVQFRYFGRMFGVLRNAFHHEEGHLSSFQALVVSVAGRVGSGNIAGVAVAITLGGPGAIFWMWLIGLMGMATSVVECSLAQLFKRAEPNGDYRGGPAFYIKHGLNKPKLAAVYSVLLLITFGLAFPALQSFVVASSLESSFGFSTLTSGLVLTVCVAFVIFGGIHRIAKVSEVIVPLMAVGYFALAVYILLMHAAELPGIVAMIVKSALGLDSAIGGGIGAAILQGVRRGLFSNEAGLGSAPNVAAVAYVKHPVNQGIVQAFSVFIDTLLLCTATAAMILLSDAYTPGAEGVEGVALTQRAVAEQVGAWGETYVSVALILFAFSSIVYNYYLGENSLDYFSEENQKLFNAFRLAILGLVFWGSMQDLGTIFSFADLTMGLLAVVNLLGLALLAPVARRLLRDYDQKVANGQEAIFDADEWQDLDIDPHAWADVKAPAKTDAPKP
jgi:AGCS family alanine or glycine:cation symporter